MSCVAASGSEVVAAAERMAAAPRFQHIDALRGIAALLVVWLHVTQFFHAQLAPVQPFAGQGLARIAQDFDFGRIGVMLFFLISGYVIPDSIRLDRPAPLATFAIRRVLRIFPAYWLSIPLGAYAMWWLWGRPFGASALLVNFTLLQDLVGMPAAIGVYWTLLIELLFYALCIALALLHSLHDARRIAWLAAVLGVVHTLGVFLSWRGVALGLPLPLLFAPLYLSFMLLGALLRHRDDRATMDASTRRMLAALVVYYLGVFPVAASWAIGPFNNYVVCGAIALLLFLLGGATSNLAAVLAIGTPDRVVIGASGAVSAVIGAYLALFPGARLGVVLPLGLYLQFVRVPAFLLIGLWALLQVLFAYSGPALGAVAWPAHIGGFVFGVAFALLARAAIARRLRHSRGF